MTKYKKIEFFLTLTLIIYTVIIFSKNFYSEILQRYIENPDFFKVFFSDFFLVHKGSEFLVHDKNPYKEMLNVNNYPFFNNPILFQIFKFTGNYNYETVAKFWLIFTSFVFISIPLLCKKIYNLKLLETTLIFFISFGGISLSVFLTGNISIVLGFLFTVAIYFLNKNNQIIYLFIISILSIIKFPYMIFYGLPFMINKINYKIFFQILSFVSIVFIIYLIYFYLNKELFLSWIESLKYSKYIGDNGDFGRGLFRIINNFIIENQPVNIILYFSIIFIFFCFCYYIFHNSKILTEKNNKDLAIALAIIVLTICLPRLKSYNLLIVIPSLFFLIKSFNFKIPEILKISLNFLLLFLLICWTSPYAPLGLMIIIVLLFYIDLKFNFLEREKKL